MTIASGLAAIVGLAHVLTGREDDSRYHEDGRTGGGRALCVVRPGDVDQLAEVLRFAAAADLRVIAQGGRSGLVGAGLGSDERDVIVSLERLVQPPSIDGANRTAHVTAGVPLSMLNRAAAEHGLTFPIDLGADPSIGGMIATNTGGARLLRYGDVRRNVLSVDVMAADGTVSTFGRAVWKDNSGLDLKQLVIGAGGATGLVTAATLALQPVPRATITAMLALDAMQGAVELLREVEQAFGTLLTAFEGISAAALAAAITHVPRLTDPFPGRTPGYVVLIELSAGAAFDASDLEDRLGRVLEPVMDMLVRDAVVDRGLRLWAIRHAIPEGLRGAGRVIACDIAVPRGAVPAFRARIVERIARISPMLVLHDFGHIGDGGVHANMVWPTDAGPLDDAIVHAARSAVLDIAVEEFGGSFSAEHGVGPANLAAYVRHVPTRQRALAGAVQRLMSPRPIGRIDFGEETA
ncbi:hypothetical protein ASE75_02940 [Sphingomonas sp. Leaf17]|uniref:FAD-binding oxidoreductase n=1 Tax=Sphingomonas sp. Leaf17 TaxID=1735683 RepID=UPI0006FD40B8|nr:FAD-binding oxidoreductase [Sphingomonas sp. Leaf17]KQM67858.1 hypothetical protein ASE75_02940 [Sphingomonas sp. Leaf17]